jgi:capsular polysaccharide biosynthesis protein
MTNRFDIPKYFIIKIKPSTDALDEFLNFHYVSKLDQLYIRYLKKIKPVQAAVFFSIRYVRSLLKLLISFKSLVNSRKSYPIIKFKEYVNKNGLTVTSLISSCNAQILLPKVYPLKDTWLVTPKLLSYEFGSIEVVALQNATVIGGSNMVFVDGIAICHDLYDFRVDETSEELHNLFRIDAKKNIVKINKESEHIQTLLTAAVFLDACAHNYAHWITEVLPRITAFCKDDRFKDVPLIIDQGLHINLMESLGPVVGNDRKILTLPCHQSLQIESLLLVSATGYVPFGVRSNKFFEPSHGVFNPLALKKMTEVMLEKIKKLPTRNWPDKIFLSRTNQTRNLSNSSILEAALFDRGFEQVNPGELTFLEQVQLFGSAREIVATTGSALVNAIFTPPGAKITVIMSKHQHMIYRYWLNMLSPLGLDITYILGEISSRKYLGIHADFVISDQSVLDFLADMDNV